MYTSRVVIFDSNARKLNICPGLFRPTIYPATTIPTSTYSRVPSPSLLNGRTNKDVHHLCQLTARTWARSTANKHRAGVKGCSCSMYRNRPFLFTQVLVRSRDVDPRALYKTSQRSILEDAYCLKQFGMPHEGSESPMSDRVMKRGEREKGGSLISNQWAVEKQAIPKSLISSFPHQSDLLLDQVPRTLCLEPGRQGEPGWGRVEIGECPCQEGPSRSPTCLPPQVHNRRRLCSSLLPHQRQRVNLVFARLVFAMIGVGRGGTGQCSRGMDSA